MEGLSVLFCCDFKSLETSRTVLQDYEGLQVSSCCASKWSFTEACHRHLIMIFWFQNTYKH